tara:strand:+ start:315 stop:974 length:660 start_codon:yes stop_codon:yes gene_type:complete
VARKTKRIDLEEVRRAASGQWRTLVVVLGGISPDILDNRHRPCPKCGGKDRFNTYRDFDETGGMRCNQCHPDGNADGFAAIQWLTGWEFPETLQRVAEEVGLAKPNVNAKTKAKKIDPAKNIVFTKWNHAMADWWCMKKGDKITPKTLLAFGARMGKYRNQWQVLCLPIKDLKGETVGWLMYELNGKKLPRFEGRKIVEWLKVKITYGSQPGKIRMVKK